MWQGAANDEIQLRLAEPPSANRWWRYVGGRVLLSREARQYKAEVARLLTVTRVRAIAGPVALSVTWYRGRRSGDLDKRLGVVLDALQGTAYANDSQIVSLRAERREWPGNACIVLWISPSLTPSEP